MHLPGVNNNTGTQEPDFSEFMWMAEEDLESFDNQVILEVEQNMQNQILQQIPIQGVNRVGEEEKFLQQMLEEEEARDTVFYDENAPANNESVDEIQERLRRLNTNGSSTTRNWSQNCRDVNNADFKFNPLAADFVPRVENGTSSSDEEASVENKTAAVANGDAEEKSS